MLWPVVSSFVVVVVVLWVTAIWSMVISGDVSSLDSVELFSIVVAFCSVLPWNVELYSVISVVSVVVVLVMDGVVEVSSSANNDF